MACDSRASRQPTAVRPAALVESEWILTSMHGKPALTGSRITLAFSATDVSGYSGCNWYGSRYHARGDTLRISQVEMTARACARPTGVMEQEGRYAQTLAGAAIPRTTGDTLILEYSAPDSTLIFRRRVPAKMDPAGLVGTRWRLERYSGGQVTKTHGVTLELARETLRGFAGCRRYSGSYVAQGDAIGFPSLAMAEMTCPDAGLLAAEGAFTTALSESAHYLLTPNALELYTVGGDTLRFEPM